MEWLTENKNPIRNIQTGEVKLSEKEVQRCVIQGIKQAFSLTSNPCGCCTNYGTITTVNGVELESHNQDSYTMIKQILEHLGYEVEITEISE